MEISERPGDFVYYQLRSYSKDLLESELFGYEKELSPEPIEKEKEDLSKRQMVRSF